MGLTLFEKVWNQHSICNLGDGNELLYIDRIFLHERTGSIALKSLEERNLAIRNPLQVFATIDHIVDTFPGRDDETLMPSGSDFIKSLRKSAKQSGINFFDLDNPDQGIVHVVSPEQGIALPGMTYICPDSHTCSLGALGTLAWGVGSTECEHALATNTLIKKKPQLMQINIDGKLPSGVTSKDIVLHLISEFGSNGAKGYAVEFTGSTITDLEIESRLTLCNMAVEFGAVTSLIAPDEKTFSYLENKKFAPKGDDFLTAVKEWRKLKSDPEAKFDKIINLNCSNLTPYVTWGTSPHQAVPIDEIIPLSEQLNEHGERKSMNRALEYMDLSEGEAIKGKAIDAAFIGSCTNSRISDLRAAAQVLKNKKVAKGVKAICVPGSSQVKKQAEEEGLDKIFISAGFEWRESGCSMCFFAGGESFGHNERVISTTNRNFENRQGKATRTHLASPETVAASAINGKISQASTGIES